MATAKDILQKVLLEIQTQVKQGAETNKALKDIQSSLQKTNSSLKNYTKSTNAAAKSMTNFVKVAKGMGKVVLSLGKGALGAVATAAGVVSTAIQQTSAPLQQLATNSVNASRALNVLERSYRDIRRSSVDTLVSIQDLGDTLNEFINNDLARGSIAFRENFIKGIGGLQAAFAEVFTSDVAGKYANEFANAFGDQFSMMEDSIINLGDTLREALEIKTTDPQRSVALLNEVISELSSNMALVADPEALNRSLQSIIQLRDNINNSGSALITPIQNANQLANALSKIWDDAQLELFSTFGNEIGEVLKWLRAQVKVIAEELRNWIDKGGLDKFKAKLIEIKDEFSDYIFGVRDVIGWVKSLVSWWNNLGDSMKTIIKVAGGVSAAYAFIPGVSLAINGLLGLIGNLGSSIITNIGKSFAFVNKPIAASVASIANFAKIASGIGAGALAGNLIGGYGARALGYNEQQQEAASGAGGILAGAAAGGALFGPLGAGLGAATGAAIETADAFNDYHKILKKGVEAQNATIAAAQQQANRLSQQEDPLSQLKAKRASIVAQLGKENQKNLESQTGVSGFLKGMLGFEPQDSKKLQDLEKQLKQINDQIKINIAKSPAEEVEKVEESADDLAKTADKVKKAVEDIGENAPVAEFLELVKRTKEVSEQADLLATSIERTANLIKTLGPNASLAGQSLGNFITEKAPQALERAVEALTRSGDAARRIGQMMDQINTNKDEMRNLEEQLAGVEGDEEKEKIQKRINKLIASNANIERRRKEVLNEQNSAVQSIQTAWEQVGAREEEAARYAEMQKDLLSANVNIMKGLYGTAGLGVQAQLKLVDALGQQKTALQGQLGQTQNLMRDQKTRIDLYSKELEIQQKLLKGASPEDRQKIEETINDLQKKRDVTQQAIYFGQKQQLELATKIQNITAEQVNQLKEVRDGYLDAVQAQAFGAGKFEKIIITQEKNIAVALEKGIAKANFLLGQVGEAARATDTKAYRFSASGMGGLESLDGTALSPEDWARRAGEVMQNISEPMQRAAHEEAYAAVMRIHAEFQPMHEENKFLQESQIEALDRNTSALDRYANEGARVAGTARGVRGAAYEGVVSGQAANEIMQRGRSNMPVGVNNYSAPSGQAKIPKINTEFADRRGVTLAPSTKKEIEQREKIRQKNAAAFNKSQAEKSMEQSNRAIAEAKRKHYEAKERLWGKDQQGAGMPNVPQAPDQPSLPTGGGAGGTGSKERTLGGKGRSGIGSKGLKQNAKTMSDVLINMRDAIIKGIPIMQSIEEELETEEDNTPKGNRGSFNMTGSP